jgi:hypothetical protein
VLEHLEKLERLARELDQRGETSIARQIAHEVAALRSEVSPPELMTTSEAARMLDVDPIFVVSWVRGRKLEGYRRNGDLLVSARSVAAIAESPQVARVHAFERRLDEALAPLDIGEDEEFEFGDTWVGRKPWAADGPARS